MTSPCARAQVRWRRSSERRSCSPTRRAAAPCTGPRCRTPQFTETVVTKSFSGPVRAGAAQPVHRRTRGEAPFGYPEIHYLTSPVRAASVRAGDPHGANVWAGTGFKSIRARPSTGRHHRLDSPSEARRSCMSPVSERAVTTEAASLRSLVCGTRTTVSPLLLAGVGVDDVRAAGWQRDADVAVVGVRVQRARGGREVDIDVAVGGGRRGTIRSPRSRCGCARRRPRC